MAAGASSPELFSSIVALFITHSSLGLGTIVGSEIFNQLIICAGAVFASKTGRLQLDKAIVTREVGFYALAIVLLYIALQDVEPLPSDPDGPDHIFISFWEAIMVFSGYVLYVIVCANFQSILDFFQKASRAVDAAKKTMYGSMDGRNVMKTDIDVEKMPFVMERKNLSDEPVDNWNTVQYYRDLKTRTSDLSSFDEGRQSLRSDGQNNIPTEARESTASHISGTNYMLSRLLKESTSNVADFWDEEVLHHFWHNRSAPATYTICTMLNGMKRRPNFHASCGNNQYSTQRRISVPMLGIYDGSLFQAIK